MHTSLPLSARSRTREIGSQAVHWLAEKSLLCFDISAVSVGTSSV